MKRPFRATEPNGPSQSSSIKENPGDSSSGTRKVRPSSPPVMSDSCDARVKNAEATAKVIMAKKMARTRSENNPINRDNINDKTSADATPTPMASQVGPMPLRATATP